MTYQVTSWFIDQTQSHTPGKVVRRMLIGGSDYSDRVTRWPKFKHSWNDIKPTNFSLRLSNADKGLNFLRDNKVVLASDVSMQFGFLHPSSGEELIEIYKGNTSRVRYARGYVDLHITDKFDRLGHRIIGTSNEPVTLTDSNYLPSDIAWYAVTSYGGFSSDKSVANPDIDYASWLEWSAVFSADAVFMHAHLDGVKVLETLRKIGRHTLSAIFFKQGKIAFHRFSIADEGTTRLTTDDIGDVSVEFDNRNTVNRQFTHADYSVASNYWTTIVQAENVGSINSFGLFEDVESDKNIWYVGSVGALNYAQWMMITRSVPYDKIKIGSFLHGFVRSVGETIIVEDDFINFDPQLRIMDMEIDMNDGKSSFSLEAYPPGSFNQNVFRLDVSQLNGADVLA